MNNFIKVTIEITDEAKKEELIAQLSLLDFDGFEETGDQLIGYILEEKFSENELSNLIQAYSLNHSLSVIEPQNWNALWESNFMPVKVDDFCSIRSEFHEKEIGVEHEIIITPKMSFGTGHHATTYLMVRQMRELDLAGKQVVDFGTGTGILAILAEKLGSEMVLATDHDDWSIENALENIEKNGCNKIKVQKADGFSFAGPFHIILANINKNVILENLNNLVDGLAQNGKLLLSGLLKNDEADIVNACQKIGLEKINVQEKDGWISILLKK